MTTLLGIGPRPARSWLDSLFSAAYAQELASGGTGCDTAHRRLVFIMSLQASAVRSTAHMVTTLLEAARTHARRELRGLRLGCWCEQPGPCHGLNLCEVADADIDDDADGTAP